MSGYNVILMTDTTAYPQWIRDYGLHRLASHIRENGYSCLVVNFCSEMTFDDWIEICNLAIGNETLALGFGSTWWPYRLPYQENQFVSRSLDFFPKTTPEDVFPNKGLIYDAVKGNISTWINEAKKKNPKIKIIMGGTKIDNYCDLAIDNFFVGFSETQIIDYLKDLSSKRIWPKFINHDSSAQNPSWNFKFSSTSYIEEDLLKKGEHISIEFARGCRFKCSFCSHRMIGRKDISSYLKDQDTLYKELMENYEKWGIESYRVSDDTLNDSIEKLKHIETVTNKLPFKLKLVAYIRLDIITMQPEQIEVLKNIGLYSGWIGIDSMHPTASKAIGKGMEMQRKKETLYKLKECWKDDVFVDCGYIIGLPGEGSDSIKELTDWAISENSPIDRLSLTPLFLNTNPDFMPHYQRSDMDINYQKYGYEVPNKEHPYLWTKNDDTDIKNFFDAVKLSSEMMTKMKSYHEPKFGDLYSEIYENPKTEYFPKLINILKNKFDINQNSI